MRVCPRLHTGLKLLITVVSLDAVVPAPIRAAFNRYHWILTTSWSVPQGSAAMNEDSSQPRAR